MHPPTVEPSPASILLIRPSALGDVCRTVPVLASLRAAYPNARIDWLVQDAFKDAIIAHPDLTGVVPFPRKALGQDLAKLRPGSTRAFLRTLRSTRYTLVIDAQGLFRSGMLARATRAPRRIGYANAQEFGWLGYTERHHIPSDRHAVDRMLELLARAGIPPIRNMTLHTQPAWKDWAAGALRLDTDTTPRVAVLAPTSRWPGKRWPADRFASVANALLERGYTRIAIVGATHERSQCAPLLELCAREPRVIDLIGTTTVGQLMAIIERAALVIANDSAAIHMAVGFNRPMIALYGPTHISRVGPYLRDADVIQHVTPADTLDHKDEASGLALMQRITINDVLARIP